MRRADLDHRDGRRFRTGRPSLDLVHTGGEGPLAVWELLHEPSDLATWLAVVVDADVVRPTAADLAATKRLRAAHRAIAEALIAGEALPPRAVATVNRAAARPPLVPRLDAAGGLALQPGTTTQALATLARDLQQLVASPLARRVRVCASDSCGLIFVDASRPGRRRWCSMERCGTIAKTRAHRARGG